MLLSTTLMLTAALMQGSFACCGTRDREGRCEYPDGGWRARSGYCCGISTCNIFCCNCKGGCTKEHGIPRRRGLALGSIDLSSEVCYPSTGGVGDCANATFLKANLAGDGKMSLQEYVAWADANFPGMALGETVAHFDAYDANGDGFISEDELHRAKEV